MNKHTKLIFLTSTAAYLTWILTIQTIPQSDFEYYHQLAAAISTGGQWGDTYTSVGYSIFLSLFYKLFGINIFIAKLLNVALSIINNLLLYKILSKINLKSALKAWVLGIFAFFPSTIYYNSIVGSEILFTTLLLGITYLYLSEISSKYILMGILAGLNNMLKPFFLAFFAVVFLTDFLYHKKLFKAFKSSMVVLITAILVLSPWLYRNYQLIGQPTYVSNNGGIVLYINNNDQNKTGVWMSASEVENSLIHTAEYEKANPTKRNKMLTKAALNWIKGHPLQFSYLGYKRLANTYWSSSDMTYFLNGTSIQPWLSFLLTQSYNIAKKLFSILGILYIFEVIFHTISVIKGNKYKERYSLFFAALFLMFSLVYFVTEGQARYAFPLNFIFVYGGVLFIKDKWRLIQCSLQKKQS